MTEPAHLAVVERVVRESGVDSAVPSPSWGDYMHAVLEAFFDWLSGHLPSLRGLASLPTLLGPVAAVIVVVLVLSILVAIVRILVLARREREASPVAGRPPSAMTPWSPAAPARDRRQWREEIDRRLAAGDVAGALEALWWWFASAVSAAPVDHAWTTRELIAHSRRLELAPLGARLDRLLYGQPPPQADDVLRFVRQGEEGVR